MRRIRKFVIFAIVILAWLFHPYLEYLGDRPVQNDFEGTARMGLFESEDGIDLLVSVDADRGLRVFDVHWTSGIPGKVIPLSWRLWPVHEKTFHIKDRDGAVAATLEFPDNDRMTIRPAADGSELVFRRQENPPYRQHLIEYENDGVELAATVFAPNRPGPTTGVVMIHGSGRSDRNNLWYIAQADYLARRGFTVLLPDKRGSGRSGGLWKMASIDDLTGDSNAAANALLEMDDVSVNSAGFVGLSQGGRIAPLAANQNEKIAFIVNVVGGLTTINEGLDHESFNLFRGHTPEPMMAPLIFIASQIARARRPIWWFKNGSYDPAPHWANLKIPGLIIWGAEDEYDNVPVIRSTAILENINQRRAQRGAAPIEVEIYPGMGHGLFDENGRISNDYLSFLARWIVTNSAGETPLRRRNGDDFQ